MKYWFYSRVSTTGQDTARQIEAFNEYINKNNIVNYEIIEEYYTGKTLTRPKYNAMKQLIKENDVLVILDLDRLGRNMVQMKKEWAYLNEHKINIEVLNMPILNTTNKSTLEKQLIANIVFELMAYMAEKERVKISERTKEGLAAKMAKGVKLGRPNITLNDLPKDFEKYARLLAKKQITKGTMSKILNISRPTLDKYLKIYNKVG